MTDAHLFRDPSVPEPATLGLMAQLKVATSKEHAAIERVVPLMDPSLDHERYARYLAAMYAFHRRIEGALASVDGLRAALPDFDERRKLPLLLRDLAALGHRAPAESAPRSFSPALDSVGRALGALYVLEGSTLGGRILSRHLYEKLGVTSESGGAYLASYGERLSLMWRSFGARVETWAGGRDPSPVIASAQATFDGLGRWLSRGAHDRH